MKAILARNIVGGFAAVGLLFLLYMITGNFLLTILLSLPIIWFLMKWAYGARKDQ